MLIQMRAEELTPFDYRDVLGHLGLPQDHPFGSKIRKLLAESRALARPKALIFEHEVIKVTKSAVTIGEVTLTCPQLAAKLKDGMKVYPSLRTCGRELENFAGGLKDFGDRYAFDAVMDCYQYAMKPEIQLRIADLLPSGTVAEAAYPGESLQWDVREQKKLFTLFGVDAEDIGVYLNDRCLMTPLKSLTCLYYPVEGACEDCSTCKNSKCTARKGDFERDAFWRDFYHF